MQHTAIRLGSDTAWNVYLAPRCHFAIHATTRLRLLFVPPGPIRPLNHSRADCFCSPPFVACPSPPLICSYDPLRAIPLRDSAGLPYQIPRLDIYVVDTFAVYANALPLVRYAALNDTVLPPPDLPRV